MTTLRQHRRLVQEALKRYVAEHPDDFDAAMRASAVGWLVNPHGSPAEQAVYLRQAHTLTGEITAGHEHDGLRYLADAGLSIAAMLALTDADADLAEDLEEMEGFGLDFRTWAAQQRTQVT